MSEIRISLPDRVAMKDNAVRIAFLVNRFGPGGLERCISHIVNGIDVNKFEPLIISFRPIKDAPNWIKRENIGIHSLNKNKGNDPRLVLRLAKLLREQNISIAQSHNWATLVETSLACRFCSVAHIHAEHGQQDRAYFENQGIKRWLHGTI